MNNKKLYKLLQIIIVLVCLVIISKIIIEEKKFLEIFLNLNFYKFLPTLILSFFITFCYSQLILNILNFTTEIKISQRKWLYIFFNSQFLDVIPFTGFIYKAMRLKKFNLDYSHFFFSYVLIFVLWIIIYCFFFFTEITFYSFFINNLLYFKYGLFFLILCITLLITIELINKFLSKLYFKKIIFLKFKSLVNFIKQNILKKKIINTFLKYGLILHILEFGLYYSVINFLGLEIDLKAIFLIFLVNSIVDFFPITPKNIGFSEFISGLLLNIIGFNFTTGVLIKVSIRISSLISTTILFFANNLYDKK